MIPCTIALGRQFGSGGREIGQRLAGLLDIPCYDGELITLAAQRAEVREELFRGKEEKAANPWLYTGVYQGGPDVKRGQPAEDILFHIQSQLILELSRKGPCIVVGRCADHVLRTHGMPVRSLFLCAPLDWRVRRRMELEHVGEKQAADEIKKTDRQRKRYYDTYTGRHWGVPDNYDLCVNSAVLGTENTARELARFLRSM